MVPQVASICEKVLAMSVEEPLMKLLSGYECILSKAQVCHLMICVIIVVMLLTQRHVGMGGVC